MDPEALATSALLALGLLPILALGLRARSRGAKRLAIAAWLAAPLAVLALAGWYRPVRVPEAEIAERPIRVPEAGYATSDTCRDCHPRPYATWRRSYHRTMTQTPGPESVRAPVDGSETEIDGHRFSLKRRDGGYFMTSEDPGGTGGSVERQVVLTTGSHHQQAYWFPAGNGRKISVFHYFYQIEESRWLSVDSAFLSPPGMPQFTLGGGEWNFTCNRCHATRSKPRLEESGAADTHVLEFGISCESCHGAGAAHVAANQDPRRRYALHAEGKRDATIVNPAALEPRLASQVCGQCHGVFFDKDENALLKWAEEGLSYRPGDELTDSRAIVRYSLGPRDPTVAAILAREPMAMRNKFWSDGMVRISGREYNGLLESPCYRVESATRARMTCMSCHRLHKADDDPRSLDTWADDQLNASVEGDANCVQCHHEYDADAARASHAHHKPESTGTRCVNCHMPHTTYGLLKAERSHTIDSPDVKTALETGRPNACNLCHLDRTLAWTAKYLKEWYRKESPPLDEDESTIAAAVLWALKGDAGQRALAAWHMGWPPALEASGSEWTPPYLSQLLGDDYGAVRLTAYRAIRTQPDYTDLKYDFLAPRASRAEAARHVYAIWVGRRRAGDGKDRRPLLLDGAEKLNTDLVRRLLSQRDTRPLYLNE